MSFLLIITLILCVVSLIIRSLNNKKRHNKNDLEKIKIETGTSFEQEEKIIPLIPKGALCCKYCNFFTLKEKEILNHVQSNHLESIIKPFTLHEMRSKNFSLPKIIHKCLYCNNYVQYSGSNSLTSDIIHHQKEDCVNARQKSIGSLHIQWEIIDKVDEIMKITKISSWIYKCRLCEWEKENPSREDKTQHIGHHENEIYSVQ